MKNYRSSEKVNAGSMADIAFLLLIFFLVTTTIATDKGINRTLPEKCPDRVDCTKTILEQNVLRIVLNNDDKILVADEQVELKDLKALLIKHIDNNADGTCTYCGGSADSSLSNNPKEAVLSLQHHRETSYELFVLVHDEISKAYWFLKDNYAKKIYNKPLSDVTTAELKSINTLYPVQISEVMTKN